ncbi:MAG: ribosome hibernation-promoting factor, HPF/YfiA family [Phycisphaerae bacterium]
MNIIVKSRHMNSSDSLKEYVDNKCQRLPRYYDGIQSVEVILDHEADQSLSEIIVTARKKHTFVATNRADDMYASIDGCVDKIAQQLRRFKDKVRDRQAVSSGELAQRAIEERENNES